MSEPLLYQTEEGQELLRAAVAALDGLLDGDLSVEETIDYVDGLLDGGGKPPPPPSWSYWRVFPPCLYPEFPRMLEEDPETGRTMVYPIPPNPEGWVQLDPRRGSN